MNYIKLYEDFKYSNVLPDNFLEDCKPFIETMRKCPPKGLDYSLFYRGIKHSTQKDFYEHPIVPLPYNENQFHCYKINHNWDRRPLDTPSDAHDSFNKVFKEKFGWNVRSGIFATRNREDAGSYGECFIFVPIGKLEYCWSPKYKDFYGDLEGDMMSKFGSYYDYLDYAQMMWDNEYGYYSSWNRDAKGGQWVYDPKNIETGLSNKYDAIELITKKYPEATQYEFRWKPAVEFDDYKLSEEDWRKEKEEDIKEIVNTYITDRLCDTEDYEVSFKCDSYYVFGVDNEESDDDDEGPNYAKILRDIIWGR